MARRRSPMAAPVTPPKRSDRKGHARSDVTVGQLDEFERGLRQERRTEKQRTRITRARAVEAESRARRARSREPSRLPRTAPARTRSDAYVKLPKDDRPAAAGPRSRGRPPSRGRRRSSLDGLSRSIARLGTRRPRQVLLAEGVGVFAVVVVDRAAHGKPPAMVDFVAPFVVFLLLAVMTEFGDQAARLASGLGALVLVATAMAHADSIARGFGVVAAPKQTAGKGD